MSKSRSRLPLQECWQADVPRLKALARKQEAGKLNEALDASKAKVAARRKSLPKLQFPDELPVSHKLEDIAAALDKHQVVVICGETGSGKSTQLPKLMLELGRGTRGMIAHTQPRRVAARSIARRLSEELGTEMGQEVGFKIRFKDQVSDKSYIKVLTDGMLLAEVQGDRFLDQYDTIIIDEAHERSLNIDFLLGYLKQLLPKRPDLKVIITSATIDPESFSQHFEDAPIIHVSGRTYPVETRYRPLVTDDPDEADRDMTQGILEAVNECWKTGPGDILIFLSGEREIRETAEALRKRYSGQSAKGVEILPLFSRLSASDQDRVFNPGHHRRIVLATNVAETSLTVPRISFVIDPGQARISRYSARSKVQRLPIEKISQASANQRKGRCGRISNGVCVRLYSEEDFEQRPEFTDPEIHRTNLASVILQMQLLGLGDIEQFPFLMPPDERYVSDGYRILHEIGAVDEHRRITKLGREIARLPVDPRLGRVLLAAREINCLKEIMTIVAVMAIQDPRERPMEKAQAADQAHAEFNDDNSDFLAFINLWNAWQEVQQDRSGNQARKWCKQNFLAYMRMREWQDIRRQLAGHFRAENTKINEADSDYSEIHRALLHGFISQIGLRDEAGWYEGARGLKFKVFPGSALFKGAKKGGGPKWIVAGEVVETGQMWARKVARVEPAWLEEAGAHLLKQEFFEPHWEAASGRVAAFEKLTLYGLPIVPKRRVNYGPKDKATARTLFIREGLVRHTLEGKYPFLDHNYALTEEAEDLEARVRRRDILVEESALEALYHERVPDKIYDGISFAKWYRRNRDEAEKLLRFSKEDVLARSPDDVSADLYPETLVMNGIPMPVEYSFDPTGEADGVTLDVPVELVGQVDKARLEWLVPGYLEEKITAMIRALPKSLRRNFVPAPDFARAAAESMEFGKGDLAEQLAHHLTRMTGNPVDADVFRGLELPRHLVMKLRLRSADGKVIDSGEKISELQQRHAGRATMVMRNLKSDDWPEQHGTDWIFGDRHQVLEIDRGGIQVKAYPALEDRENSVASVLSATAEQAEQETRGAVLKLLSFTQKDVLKFARKNIDGIDAMCLRFKPIASCESLREDIVQAALASVAGEAAAGVRSAAQFRELGEHVAGALQSEINAMAAVVEKILEAHHAVAKQLTGNIDPRLLAAATDIKTQLRGLVHEGFVSATPRHWLAEIPRYLQAIDKRIERLQQNPTRDKGLQQQVRAQQERLESLLEDSEKGHRMLHRSPALRQYRWLLEEFRVSVFAQELGTRHKVSEKRLDEQWRLAQQELRRES